MEIAPMVTATTATTTVTIPDPDSPDPGSEAPTRIQSARPISFSNGKRYHHHHRTNAPAVAPLPAVTYRECLKNHAAGIGGHALDGCGEFMPSPSSNPTDPTSLTCAACGCHRNFHRRDDPTSSSSAVTASAVEFRPHNRHHPPPPPLLPLPPPPIRSPDDGDSASPPPISSSYMLLALSGGGGGSAAAGAPGTVKRFRTKFSMYQKERMLELAERLGWRMPKAAEDAAVRDFCREIGVDKGVFKVWMHNNKSNGRGGGRRGFSLAGDRREKVAESDHVGGGGAAADGSFSL